MEYSAKSNRQSVEDCSSIICDQTKEFSNELTKGNKTLSKLMWSGFLISAFLVISVFSNGQQQQAAYGYSETGAIYCNQLANRTAYAYACLAR